MSYSQAHSTPARFLLYSIFGIVASLLFFLLYLVKSLTWAIPNRQRDGIVSSKMY